MPRPAYLTPDAELAASLGVLAPSVAARVPDVRRRVGRGVWRRYGRVVVCHNGPLTAEQQVWVAVLRSPQGVVLSGLTAAVRRGLRAPQPARPELLVPAGGPLPHLPGVDVARTRLLTAIDVHPTAQPPQLRLPRAVVDRASRLDRPDDVRALLCAAVQQRLVRAEHLREVVERLGPLRHRGLLLRTLDDVEAGAHSVRELQFLRVVRRGGLPAPDLQVVRLRPGGRHYLDARWERYCLHVEVDGLGHLLVSTWAADLDRANELQLAGASDCCLRIPGFWLDERPEHVVEQVRRGLLRGGWRPQVRVPRRATRRQDGGPAAPSRSVASRLAVSPAGSGDCDGGARGTDRHIRRDGLVEVAERVVAPTGCGDLARGVSGTDRHFCPVGPGTCACAAAPT